MEADWEFDLGRESPRIEGVWPGLVDLRCSPQSVDRIVECQRLPGLREALLRLNALRAPVWTSKCDVWRVDSFDPDELDAPHQQVASTLACYVDLLPRADEHWRSSAAVEAACRVLCARLHDISLRCCRADLVIRSASIPENEHAFGITTYLVACGSTEAGAKAQLSAALDAVVDWVVRIEPQRSTECS